MVQDKRFQITDKEIIENWHGRIYRYAIVDEIPDGYFVWSVGRQNFPLEGWLPLARMGKNKYDWQCNIDPNHLLAINIHDEAKALACLKAASRGTAKTKEDFLKIINS